MSAPRSSMSPASLHSCLNLCALALSGLLKALKKECVWAITMSGGVVPVPQCSDGGPWAAGSLGGGSVLLSMREICSTGRSS